MAWTTACASVCSSSSVCHWIQSSAKCQYQIVSNSSGNWYTYSSGLGLWWGYRNWCLDALEFSFALNLIILVGATFYVNHSGGNQLAVGYISVSIALITFIGILAYHIFQQMRSTKLWKKMPKLKLKSNRQYTVQVVNECVDSITLKEIADFSRLCETLLEDLPQVNDGVFWICVLSIPIKLSMISHWQSSADKSVLCKHVCVCVFLLHNYDCTYMTVYLAVKTVVIATVLLILVCYHVYNYIHQSPCLAIIHWTQITALPGKTGNKAMSREQTIMLGISPNVLSPCTKERELLQKGNCYFKKPFVIWVLGEWTYDMDWQLIVWTDWLRIQNTLQQSPFPPSLMFTHPHHEHVICHSPETW